MKLRILSVALILLAFSYRGVAIQQSRDATGTRKSRARERGERAKNYLVKEGGLLETQIVVVNGGYRKKPTIELFVTPFGALPPTASPK